MSAKSDLALMPPCEAAFIEHYKRVFNQREVWYTSHEQDSDLPDPEEFGWCKVDAVLQPKFYEGPMASEVLDRLICQCPVHGKCGVGPKEDQVCSCKENNIAMH